jgi:hypothetical protein
LTRNFSKVLKNAHNTNVFDCKSQIINNNVIITHCDNLITYFWTVKFLVLIVEEDPGFPVVHYFRHLTWLPTKFSILKFRPFFPYLKYRLNSVWISAPFPIQIMFFIPNPRKSTKFNEFIHILWIKKEFLLMSVLHLYTF